MRLIAQIVCMMVIIIMEVLNTIEEKIQEIADGFEGSVEDLEIK